MILTEKPGTPEELVHFGIKGMKWGVRKKEGTSEVAGWSDKKKKRVERRAQKHEKYAKQTQKQIDAIKANPSRIGFVQRGRDKRIKELEGYRDQYLKNAKDLRAGHLTKGQKQAIIGASAVAVTLAAYGTYKFVDSGNYNQMIRMRNTPLKKNELLSRQMSTDALIREVVKPINPGYGGVGTKMNCRRATFAYELRRRGYDVKATNSVGGTGQTVAGMLNATDPNSNLKTGIWSVSRNMNKEGHPVAQAQKIAQGLGRESVNFGPRILRGEGGRSVTINQSSLERSQSIFDAIGKHGDGARGELGLGWKMGGAHSMAWENINGKPTIFDTQTGITYRDAKEFFSMSDNVGKAGITRLDNVTLNENFLRKWVRNNG